MSGDMLQYLSSRSSIEADRRGGGNAWRSSLSSWILEARTSNEVVNRGMCGAVHPSRPVTEVPPQGAGDSIRAWRSLLYWESMHVSDHGSDLTSFHENAKTRQKVTFSSVDTRSPALMVPCASSATGSICEHSNRQRSRCGRTRPINRPI